MGGAWCGHSFGDSGMHALLHLCCCLTNTFVQTQNSQLKTETRTIESQTKIIVTQTRATQTKSVDWLSQNNSQHRQSFNDGVGRGEADALHKCAAILDLLQSDEEIAEAADVLRNARMSKGARAGKFDSAHKMSVLQASNFHTFELTDRAASSSSNTSCYPGC